MHCELIVPGLLAAGEGNNEPPGGAERLPALELLLARGRGTRAEALAPERWLHAGFGLAGEAPLAAGALTLLGAGSDPGDACWARADPVHLRLMRERLIVMPAEAFEIGGDEAQALCEALSRHFAGALELVAVQPQRWCARLGAEFAAGAQPALDAAGRDVDLGAAAGADWRRLLNEAQMLLHAHPVNEARETRGEPAINSLWLWGAACAPRAAQSRWQAVLADDPLALGLARLARTRGGALPASAEAWLERAPEDGRHLVVLDALRAPRALGQSAEYRSRAAALEARWFAPLLAALRAGRVGMVSVHVPDGAEAASFETIRADLRRFWRRARPLAHYA